jgi:spermidine/putrescine transport system permease protein
VEAARSAASFRWTRIALLAWTLGVLLFLYLPIALIVVFSFNDSALNIFWQGFTTRWYVDVFRDAPLMLALRNSAIIAAITTLGATILGTVGAWLLHRYHFPAKRILMALIFFPMIVPEVIMGVSLLLLFSAAGVGLGFGTVICAHITFCFPFVMVAVAARLEGLDPSLEEAAVDLGATPAGAFVRVVIPYLMPSIIAGALMAFTLSIDEFVVTYFTASAGSVTLPLKIYGLIKPGLTPAINALSTMLIVATIVLVGAGEFARRLSSGSTTIK